MNEIYESLDSLRYQREALKKWWDQNQAQLSPEQQDALFDWAVDDKFDYLPIIIGLTLDTVETVPGLITNLERISSHIDQDLAWDDFFTALEEKLNGDIEFVRKLYHELPAETRAWPRKHIGTIMAELPEDEAIKEILRLLRSKDLDKVDVGVRGLRAGFRNEEVPSEVVDELIQLAEDSIFHEDILRINSALFKSNSELWELSLDIGWRHPTTIQRFINLYGPNIDRDHLPDYITLLEQGLEADTIDDIQPHYLYLDFSDEAELLANFAITLSEHQLTTTKRLVEEIADRHCNDEILPALFQRIDEFSSDFHGTEVVFAAGKQNPNYLISQIIDHSDDLQRLAMLELLQKAVGKLFTSTTYEKQPAIDIANFLETLDDSNFVRSIKRELIEEEPDDENLHNKDVYHHLHGVISDHLDSRDYDSSTLHVLNDYPSLKSHFHIHLTRKINQSTYHPMLNLLRNGVHTHLQFLEDNWESIPQSKQRQLLGQAFDSTLSEIGLLLWLDNRDHDYDIDVNLHTHDTGEEIDKDIDIVVDGNYIEIRTPKTWRNLKVANEWIGIPNTAYNKIADKFRSDYVGTAELTQKPTFIALDITASEISHEDIVSSLYGSINIQLTYNTETGEAVGEQLIRDPNESLQGWPLLDDNLNGVIWYTARIIEDTEGNPYLQVKGDLVPNPHHQDEDNFDYCADLEEKLFGDS